MATVNADGGWVKSKSSTTLDGGNPNSRATTPVDGGVQTRT